MYRYLLAILTLAFITAACGEQPHEPVQQTAVGTPSHDRLIAVIHPTEGNSATGQISFTRAGDEVRIEATISGLTPENRHGFHIHQYGDCSEGDGTSAGGHFNPHGMPHASPGAIQRHAGDLGNLTADENGVATMQRLDPILSFEGAASILGRGVIVHAGEDDFQTQPTGDAGGRIGCGVIGVKQPG